jgi:hypothetical protein
LGYLYPSIPSHVIQYRTCKWYEARIHATIEDLLRATGYWAVSRSLISSQRRAEIPPERQIRSGRKVYYLMRFEEIPPKARRFRKEGSHFIDREDTSDDEYY